MRFESASTKRVDEYPGEVSELMRHFALILKEPEDTEDKWRSYTFVTDESRLADFFHEDSEPEQLEKLSGVNCLKMCDLICDIAYALRQNERIRESELPR